MKKGLTQKELAGMVGLNKDSVRNWERYETAPLRSDVRLTATCELLGVDLLEMKGHFPWSGRLSRNGK